MKLKKAKLWRVLWRHRTLDSLQQQQQLTHSYGDVLDVAFTELNDSAESSTTTHESGSESELSDVSGDASGLGMSASEGVSVSGGREGSASATTPSVPDVTINDGSNATGTNRKRRETGSSSGCNDATSPMTPAGDQQRRQNSYSGDAAGDEASSVPKRQHAKMSSESSEEAFNMTTAPTTTPAHRKGKAPSPPLGAGVGKKTNNDRKSSKGNSSESESPHRPVSRVSSIPETSGESSVPGSTDITPTSKKSKRSSITKSFSVASIANALDGLASKATRRETKSASTSRRPSGDSNSDVTKAAAAHAAGSRGSDNESQAQLSRRNSNNNGGRTPTNKSRRNSTIEENHDDDGNNSHSNNGNNSDNSQKKTKSKLNKKGTPQTPVDKDKNTMPKRPQHLPLEVNVVVQNNKTPTEEKKEEEKTEEDDGGKNVQHTLQITKCTQTPKSTWDNSLCRPALSLCLSICLPSSLSLSFFLSLSLSLALCLCLYFSASLHASVFYSWSRIKDMSTDKSRSVLLVYNLRCSCASISE